MSDDKFTTPESSADRWVDVRMRDPQEEEWDIDAVVAGGQVEYVDLRVQPDVLPGFIGCLLDDVGTRRTTEILSRIADRNGLTVQRSADADPDDGD